MRPLLSIRLAAVAICLLAAPLSAQAGPLPDDGKADYQLGGGYPPAPQITIVARDSTDNPAPGLFIICYVNGFQTQPGATWPKDLLVPGPDGRPLADPGWPDEFLLDIATPAGRERNLTLVRPAIELCKKKGFDAIEFDNLDSYTRSNGYLSKVDALAFAKLLVEEARQLGLPAGQKNAGDFGTRGRDEAGFSFAVAEECNRWQECATYTDVYGIGQVIDIEYADDLRVDFDTACAQASRPTRMILRDRMLAPAGAEGYLFQSCD